MRKTLIVFALVLLCSSFAGAQTSESVCDGEQGAAYGLCNAFCDAMDCDGDDPQASETACNKVQSKFEQVTGHQPPCLTPPVSCVCNETLPGFLAAASAPVESCVEDGDVVRLFTEVGEAVAFGSFGCAVFLGASGAEVATTPAEALACIDFLRATAAAAGVPCS